MTRENRNTIIEYLVLCGFLAVLMYCVIAGSRYAARARAEAEREKHFKGAHYTTPATTYHDPGNPDEWTEDQWAEFVAMYATATPEERAEMDAWLAMWFPNWHPRFSGSRRVIVGSEGRRHRYTRVHGVARQLM